VIARKDGKRRRTMMGEVFTRGKDRGRTERAKERGNGNDERKRARSRASRRNGQTGERRKGNRASEVEKMRSRRSIREERREKEEEQRKERKAEQIWNACIPLRQHGLRCEPSARVLRGNRRPGLSRRRFLSSPPRATSREKGHPRRRRPVPLPPVTERREEFSPRAPRNGQGRRMKKKTRILSGFGVLGALRENLFSRRDCVRRMVGSEVTSDGAAMRNAGRSRCIHYRPRKCSSPAARRDDLAHGPE